MVPSSTSRLTKEGVILKRTASQIEHRKEKKMDTTKNIISSVMLTVSADRWYAIGLLAFYFIIKNRVYEPLGSNTAS